jgi:predicted outer membrane repeat protein
MAGFFASFWHFFAFGGLADRAAFCECLSCFLPFRRLDRQFFQKMVCNNCSSPDDRRARCEKYRLSRFYRVHLISKEMDRMTNKKFKLAAMSLALTACVAASPLSAGAEAPEAAADVQPSAAADTATEDKPSPETVAAEEPTAEAAADPVEETPAQSTEEPPAQETEAAPAGDAAVLPALPGARPVVVDMPAAEAPADAAGEPAEAAEDPKDAADSAEETAEDADAAEDAETPEPPEIAIARPDAAQPAVQPGIAAPAIQPGGISVMLPGETRQVALNTQASNEDGTVMGDFETVVKNAKAGQEIVLQEDYTGSLTTFDWIRLNLNKKTVTGTITVDLSGKKADGSRGAVEIVNGTITGNRNDTSGYGGGGVCADSGDLTIDHCRITDNTAANGSGGGVSMGGKHGGGIYIRNSMPNRTIAGSVTNTVEQEVLDIGSTVVISGNTAGQLGGGIYADNGVTVRLAGYLLNNHAGTAGADLYLTAGSTEDKNRNVLILRRVSKDDDWTLVDCGHTIDGWYIDGDEDGNNRWNADATVDADGNEIPKFIMNLDTLLDGSDYTILQDENGDYVITVGGKALALKAAHAVIPPEPTPDPEPTPGPNPTPDPEPTPITPETPESPEVPEAPGETPVTPISTPTQTVAPSGTHLPQTGTSLFAALAMALSGIALTAAGAWASLTGRRCRH